MFLCQDAEFQYGLEHSPSVWSPMVSNLHMQGIKVEAIMGGFGGVLERHVRLAVVLFFLKSCHQMTV